MRATTFLSALAVAAPAVLAADSSNSTMMNMTMASNMSLCDKYATALLKTSNATTQYTLLTLLVNTAVIGNYTKDPAPKNAVTGILNNGTYEGRSVSLLKYFDGMLASTNRNGAAVSVNFLDGGGATPLMNNKPANGTASNQYFLLTHLYEYFGALLQCSAYGMEGFPAYEGGASQYNIHKFMDLSYDEVSYFIQEVGLAAASFGVTADDVSTVGKALGMYFNYKCLPKTTIIPAQGAQLQSICTGENCPLAANATCDAGYQSNITTAAPADNKNKYTSTSMAPSSTAGSGSSGSGSGSSSSPSSTGNAAPVNTLGAVFMAVAGIAGLAAGL